MENESFLIKPTHYSGITQDSYQLDYPTKEYVDS